MTDTYSTDVTTIENRIRELEKAIDTARIASISSAARTRFPGVRGVILTPPDATALDHLSPELFDSDSHNTVDLLNTEARPWDRILLTTGEVVIDAERATAIAALFEGASEYPIELVGWLLDDLATAEVLGRIGWPPLATVTSNEAAYDALARANESFRDSYESARISAADGLYALLDLQAEEDTHDVEALTAEHVRLVNELRRSATEHIVGQVRGQFPDAASFVVAQVPSVPTIAELLTVVDQTGNATEPHDEWDCFYQFNVLGGAEPDGERLTFEPFAVLSTLTGEQFSKGIRITIGNGTAR